MCRSLYLSIVFFVFVVIFVHPIRSQQVLTNLPFDCKGRIDGFWRDARYCDVFHACVAGEQKRSYGCPQVEERFYFDDATQRCEFARNGTGCPSNQYYGPVTSAPVQPGGQFSTSAPTETWKIFAQSREQFTCASKPDGFYASRWCNVFYRCSGSVSNIFLCPLQRAGGRLWWIQHGSSQGIPETAAQCAFPCETGRPCSSPGGILVDNGNQISESQQEAETVYQRSRCSNPPNTNSIGANPNPVVVNPVPVGPPQTSFSSSGNQGSSFNTGSSGSGSGSGSGAGTFLTDSDVNCANQANDAFLPSPYCNVFHQCVGGSRVDFRCARANNASQDLWWNQDTKLCDWPCRVQCTKRIYASTLTAQQISSESLLFFNRNCSNYRIFKRH